jgi:hypothetical protein
MFRIKQGMENSYMIALMHNMEKPSELKTTMVIEYNPNKIELKEHDELKFSEILKRFSKKIDTSDEFVFEISDITGSFWFFDYDKDGIKEENMVQIFKPTTMVVKGNSLYVIKTYFNICSFECNLKKRHLSSVLY